MSKKKELIKNTAILFIGKFCTQFLSLLLVPIYTNYLTTSDYGYIDLIQTYITLLVPIIILRFDSGIFRFLIDERKDNRNKEITISTVFLTIISQCIIFVIIFYIISYFYKLKYMEWIIINSVSIAISSILLQLVRGLGDNISYSISSFIAGGVTLIFNIICVIILKMGGEGILIASSVANFACSLYLVFKNKIYKYVKIHNVRKSKLKKIVKYSLPMIPDGLSWWIINVSDRSIIAFVIGATANGIYAVSSKFSNILFSLFQIFNMSWHESASLHIDDDDSNMFFSEVLNNTYQLFFSICIFIMISIPVIFDFVIGKSYHEAINYIPILLLGNLFNAIANIIGGVYIAKKKTAYVAKTTMISAIINIFINVLLIRKIGLYAASVSTLIAYIFLSIYRYTDVQKYIKIQINKRFFLSSILLYVVCAVLYYTKGKIFVVVNITYGLLVCIIINRKIIKKVIKNIQKKFNII